MFLCENQKTGHLKLNRFLVAEFLHPLLTAICFLMGKYVYKELNCEQMPGVLWLGCLTSPDI